MENEIVYLTNTRPRIIHLPDDVKRTKGQNGDAAVVSLNNGKAIPPSVPKMVEGKPTGAPLPTAVDKAYWDKVKNHPQVQVWMRLGWLSVNTAPPGEALEIAGLDVQNATTAIAIVGGEDNPRLLQEWAKTESRADVRAAIDTRMAQLEAKGKGGKLPPLK